MEFATKIFLQTKTIKDNPKRHLNRKNTFSHYQLLLLVCKQLILFTLPVKDPTRPWFTGCNLVVLNGYENTGFNSFMQNVEKWPKIIKKSCGAHSARLLRYVWPFFNVMHEKINAL